MARTRYIYNPETCRYEPYTLRGKALRKKTFTYLLFASMIAVAGYFYLHQYFETVDEIILEKNNHALKIEWESLHNRIENAGDRLSKFIDKDDNNYRVILDSSPLSTTIRNAGVGGSEKINHKLLADFPSILHDYLAVEKIKNQLEVEVQSYQEIRKMLDQKIDMWASKPAIQPLSNKELTYLHTRYGQRLHPILGFIRGHKGLDFSADAGTPVYATGNGIVKNAYRSESFGNVIFIDHEYGYETRYAHLSKFNVRTGQRVKRGEIIGFVGSTGLSSGPHLHYEVLYRDQDVNPINFFQRDLSNQEYERVIDEAGKERDSID
jgi:murein DD-endopeptidase MepM/ murein hydrolase activator NlpD